MRHSMFTLLLVVYANAVFAADPPLIIPTPKYMSGGKWEQVVAGSDESISRIVLRKESPLLKTAAVEINRYIVKNGGKELPITNTKGRGLNIFIVSGLQGSPLTREFDLGKIRIPKNKMGTSQAYVVRFTANNVLLVGRGDAGALYAAVTFCHLLKKQGKKVIAYSADIDDYPDFEHRGDASPGSVFITRGYLFAPKVLRTEKTYPEMVKEYIDVCLHLKLNEMMLAPRNLRYKGKDYTQEFMRYAQARGFTVTSGIYAGFFRDKYEPKKTNINKFKAYLRRTGQTKNDFMEHIGRYFAWSNEELLRQLVREHAIKGANVHFHCPDTGDENWGKRGNKCREKFGSDRAKADAFMLNTIYDELKRFNPGNNNIKLYAVIQPYHPLYIDAKYYKYYDEYVEHYSRLHKAIPIEIALCARECARESLQKWIDIMPGRPFYLYFEHRQFHGATQLVASNIRNIRTLYFPERHDDILALKSGTSHWELDTPLGAEYSWNTGAPGSGIIDMNNKFEFDKDEKLNKQFAEMTLPRTVRFMWGADAAPLMIEAYESGLNIILTVNPFEAFKGLNRKSFWQSRRLLPELTPEMFQQQEKAANIVCCNALKIMKGEVPVQYDFLRARATRLYKHAMVVKLLAPVYVHYFAAVKALEEKNLQKAKNEIEQAKMLENEIAPKLARQKKLVKQYPQISGSFLSFGLRHLKPFMVLKKKLDKYKIPTQNELVKTNISGQAIKKLQARELVAEFTGTAPVIDGKLDDLCWKENGNAFTSFMRLPFTGTPKLAYDQTSVKICYDEKCLYVAIRAFDKDFDSIRSKEVKHDDNVIFTHDIVEVFLNPDPKNLHTAQFVVNASGSSFDSFVKKITSYKKTAFVHDWNPEWKKATSLDRKGWIAELAIPFACLMKAPADVITAIPHGGDVWRAYFSREKRGLELSGVRFIKEGGFTNTEGYPRLRFKSK